MLPAAFWLFTSLFVTRTLGIPRGDMGKAVAYAPLVAFALSLPTGFLADRFGPRVIMATGYFLMASVSAAMAFWVHDYTSFFLIMLVNAGAGVVMAIPMSPMVFQYASPGERGTIFGLIQFVRGAAAFVFSLVLGQIVQMSPSYDPTPIYLDDINKAAEIAERLRDPDTPAVEYIARQLTPELLEQLEQLDGAALRQPVADALNQVLDDPQFYTPERFAGVELPEQSRKLMDQRETEADQVVFNRSLVQTVFGEAIFPKTNYRVSYVANILVSLLGGFVVLSTKRGRYAQPLPAEGT